MSFQQKLSFFAITICLSILVNPVCGQDFRRWINREGKTITAKFEKLGDDGNIVIRKKNGKSYDYPFSSLSSSDQDYVAWISDGEIPGVEGRKRNATTPPTRPLAPKKWLLSIGIDKYSNLPDLKYCSKDVSLIAERFKGLGFRNEHVVQLDTVNPKNNKPIKKNIEGHLKRLFSGELVSTKNGVTAVPRRIAENDIVVVVFSGHGVMIGGQSFFCPSDANLADEKTLISMDKVYSEMESISNGLRLLVVDACRDVPNTEAKVEPFQIPRNLNPGLVALSSCSAGESSYEHPDLEHGVFSYYLAAALGGASLPDLSDGEKSEIAISDITEYTIRNTTRFAESHLKSLGPQTPQRIVNVKGIPKIGILMAENQIDKDLIISPEPPKPGITTFYDQIGAFGVVPKGWKKIKLAADEFVVEKNKLNLKGDYILKFLVNSRIRSGKFQIRLNGKSNEDLVLNGEYDGGYNWRFNLNGDSALVAYHRAFLPIYFIKKGNLLSIEAEQTTQPSRFKPEIGSIVLPDNSSFDAIQLTTHSKDVDFSLVRLIGPTRRNPLSKFTSFSERRVVFGKVPAGWSKIATNPKTTFGAEKNDLSLHGDFEIKFTVNARKQFSKFELKLIGGNTKDVTIEGLMHSPFSDGATWIFSTPEDLNTRMSVAHNSNTYFLRRVGDVMTLEVEKPIRRNSPEISKFIVEGKDKFDGLRLKCYSNEIGFSDISIKQLK